METEILEKTLYEQSHIARTSTSPNQLAILADSSHDSVRIIAIYNPAIGTETLKRKLHDNNMSVRIIASNILAKRSIEKMLMN